MSSDPAMADGLNWYRYANNNPIMYRDPTGLNSDPVFMKDYDMSLYPLQTVKMYDRNSAGNFVYRYGIDCVYFSIMIAIHAQGVYPPGDVWNGDIWAEWGHQLLGNYDVNHANFVAALYGNEAKSALIDLSSLLLGANTHSNLPDSPVTIHEILKGGYGSMRITQDQWWRNGGSEKDFHSIALIPTSREGEYAAIDPYTHNRFLVTDIIDKPGYVLVRQVVNWSNDGNPIFEEIGREMRLFRVNNYTLDPYYVNYHNGYIGFYDNNNNTQQ